MKEKGTEGSTEAASAGETLNLSRILRTLEAADHAFYGHKSRTELASLVWLLRRDLRDAVGWLGAPEIGRRPQSRRPIP
ncbi:hypothetical protein [Streptomyces sp. NPDC002790]|uniref:hypothetical protein n=1 Tax=Streptomyces sp. NPDC002790 TaxID=3154431 RepID=UPI00332BAF64